MLQILIFVPRPQILTQYFCQNGDIFKKNEKLHSYQLLSSDVRTDLRYLAITLSRNVKIYPITEKNPCKSGFENIISAVKALPTDEKDEGNAGNSNGGNNSDTVLYLFSGPYQQVSSSL